MTLNSDVHFLLQNATIYPPVISSGNPLMPSEVGLELVIWNIFNVIIVIIISILVRAGLCELAVKTERELLLLWLIFRPYREEEKDGGDSS